MAGILDGEGSIYIYQGKVHRMVSPGYVLMVKVSTSSEYLARLFQFWFTGSVRVRQFKEKRYLTQYEWQVCNRKALTCLEELLPYLRLKHSQAELAIRFQKRMSLNTGGRKLTDEELALREADRLLMKALKHNNN